MTSRISKGSITGRAAYSNGGLALSIGTRASRGIRNAIAKRAPDSVKIALSSGPTIYKIAKDDQNGLIVHTAQGSNTRTFVNKLNMTQHATNASTIPMFENDIANMQIEIFPTGDTSDNAIVSVLITPYSNFFTEMDFKNTSTNNYSFKFPDISYSFVNVSDKTLYLKDGVLQDVAQSTYTGFAFTFVNADVTSLNASVKNAFDNKTYNITMLSNTSFEVSATGVNKTLLVRQ